MHQSFLSFNGGELSPYLRHRIDIAKHSSGAETFSNFLPLPFGGFRKRPGTLHLAELDAATRIEPFYPSLTSRYILAFTATDLKVFEPEEGTLVEEIAAPFSDPFALQFAQVNDVLFITDPGHPPRRLSFNGEDWTLEVIPFKYPPLLDENTDEEWTIEVSDDAPPPPTYETWVINVPFYYWPGKKVTYEGVNYLCIFPQFFPVSGDAPGTTAGAKYWIIIDVDDSVEVSDTVTLYASKDLFTEQHEGALFELSQERPINRFEVFIPALTSMNGKESTALVVEKGWTFNTFGTWSGTFHIERSKDRGVTWERIREYSADGDRNVAASGEEEGRVLLRIAFTKTDAFYNSELNGQRGVLAATDAMLRGLVKITSYISPTEVEATVIRPVQRGKTHYWREGAFSDRQGYPRTLAIHDRRVIFGGTRRKPMSLWMSKTDDLLNFKTGTAADDGIFISLASQRQDPIRWIASQRRLLVGTAGGEWVFGGDASDASDQGLSATSLLVRENTRWGSAAAPAIVMGDGVYFLERQGRRVREFLYQLDRENYAAVDLSRLAEHITDSGIVQMAWQQNRESYLWAVRADGGLLAFAYNREEKIAAWSRHSTRGGFFRSVAVLRGPSGDDDVFFVVQRGDDFHLEKLAAGQHAIQEAGNVEDCHYLDGGREGATEENEEQGIHTFAVPAHLDGQLIDVLADGIAYRNVPVEDGIIVLPNQAMKVHAGLPIDSEHRILPVDIQGEDGATLSRVKRTHEVLLSLVNSRGGAISANGAETGITYTNTSDPTDSPPVLTTGWMPQTLAPGYEADLQFSTLHSEPYPFSIRAAVLRWRISEP
jgi:hypothetical protein